MSDAQQLTKGRLDGLMISPIKDEAGQIVCVDFTVESLPGLRLVLEAAAVKELHYALGVLLDQPVTLPPMTTAERIFITGIDRDDRGED
jgi:hypothetical protein